MIIVNQEGLAAFNSDFISAYIKGDPRSETEEKKWQIVVVEAGEKARVLATYSSKEKRDIWFERMLDAIDRSRDINYRFVFCFAADKKGS